MNIERDLLVDFILPNFDTSYDLKKIFNNKDNLLELYFCQKKFVIFGDITLSRGHSLDTYMVIQDYIEKTKKWNFIVKSINKNTLPFLGLFQNYFRSNARKIKPDNKESEYFWDMILLQNAIMHEVIVDYINKEKKVSIEYYSIDKIVQVTKADLRTIQKMKTMINEKSNDQFQIIYETYILLFFTMYVIAKNFLLILNSENSQTIKSIARFILVILPQVIGAYKFEEYYRDIKDMAFKVIDKSSYYQVQKKIYENLPSQDILHKIEKKIYEIRESFNCKIIILKRKKGVFSTYMKTKSYNTTVENLWDLIGYRIIIDSENVDSCYEFYGKLQSEFEQWNHEKGFVDYIKKPKKNNYQSLHYIITNRDTSLVEVQIRTVGMNNIAEFGSASHQVYKIGGNQVISDFEETNTARKGKIMLEKQLKENNLTINDFVEYIGVSLKYIPISHYYLKIAEGKYRLKELIVNIKKMKNKIQ